MKATKKLMAMLGGALLTTGLLAAPSVEITAVQQQYPWTNTVDITYEVRGVTNMEYFVRFTPTTSDDQPILNTEGEASIQVALESNGVFTAQWYPQTNLQYTACKMTPAIFRGGSGGGRDYMIVDLDDWTVTYEPMATQEASNQRYNTVEYKTKKLVLRKVSPGTYRIGHEDCSNYAEGANSPHDVVVPADTCYYIGVFEFTGAQYDRIMGTNTASTDMYPRRNVTWRTLRKSALANAELVANKSDTSSVLARLSGLTGVSFDLPTDEMWEIAARAGVATRFYWGDTFSNKYCWSSESNDNSTFNALHTVGEKLPNAWGLYDMAGNVYELCRDMRNKADLADKTTSIYTPQTTGDGNVVMRSFCHQNPIDCMEASRRYRTGANGGGPVTGFRISAIFK